MADIANELDVLGWHVKLLYYGEELHGTIFAYDEASKVLVLRQPGSHGGVSTLKFIRTNCPDELKILSATRPSELHDPILPYVDLDLCIDREKKALQQAESEAGKVGVGVTKEAQAVYDALSKTMNCSWEGQAIVVMQEIRIAPPYGPADLSFTGYHKDQGMMDRVRKVLQRERQRLGLGDG